MGSDHLDRPYGLEERERETLGHVREPHRGGVAGAGPEQRAKRPPLACAGWVPGAADEGAPCPRTLLTDFLLYTGHLPDTEVARIAGVGPSAVRKWRLLPARNVRRAVRRRIQDYLVAESLTALRLAATVPARR